LNNLKVAELFAGVGGFRLGLERTKNKMFEITWANQWEPSRKVQHAFDCYNKRFKNGVHINQDIATISNEEMANTRADMIVGGFPCQDYSVARSLSGELGIQGKKGVVLLHGLAGTGKTNYIKWLTAQIPDKDFIFVPNNMIGELAKPEFMSMLIEQKNSVLVLEDCENYIAERVGGGNQTDVVGIILNIADGILSDVLECQFICTFNADLMDIDHALLRRGRLIVEYQFGKLSIKKCNAYLKSIGKDITVDKEMTLAELTHIDEKEYKAVDDKKVGFGFI